MAFAEQMLPAAEREEILAHMSRVRSMPRSGLSGTAGGGRSANARCCCGRCTKQAACFVVYLEVGVDSGSGVRGNDWGCSIAAFSKSRERDADCSQRGAGGLIAGGGSTEDGDTETGVAE